MYRYLDTSMQLLQWKSGGLGENIRKRDAMCKHLALAQIVACSCWSWWDGGNTVQQDQVGLQRLEHLLLVRLAPVGLRAGLCM